MNRDNNKSEHRTRPLYVVGHGAPLIAIHRVTLSGCGNNTTVRLTHAEDYGVDLTLHEPVTLEEPIGAEQPFVLTIKTSGASSIPPAVLKLDDNGIVVLTEEAQDSGWQAENNVFMLGTHEFNTSFTFAGPGDDPDRQEIIIVGTVPFPDKP